jgi:hypothetical protein
MPLYALKVTYEVARDETRHLVARSHLQPTLSREKLAPFDTLRREASSKQRLAAKS